MNYKTFYDTISRPFQPYHKGLNQLNRVITTLNYLTYAVLLLVVLYQRGVWAMAWAVLVTGGGFLLLSLGRAWLNRQRPYERWGITPLLKKDSSGKSLPSRHVFSATLIGMLSLYCLSWFGVLMLTVAALLALLRVLGGVHYPSDVLVGYGLGILVGCLLFLV